MNDRSGTRLFSHRAWGPGLGERRRLEAKPRASVELRLASNPIRLQSHVADRAGTNRGDHRINAWDRHALSWGAARNHAVDSTAARRVSGFSTRSEICRTGRSKAFLEELIRPGSCRSHFLPN